MPFLIPLKLIPSGNLWRCILCDSLISAPIYGQCSLLEGVATNCSCCCCLDKKAEQFMDQALNNFMDQEFEQFIADQEIEEEIAEVDQEIED
jgi:tRNA U54 and U55 pseudouridine synthase Pus10